MMVSLLLCLSRAAQIAKQQRSIGEQTGMSLQTEHQQKRKNLAERKKQSQQEKKQILENMMQRNFCNLETEQLWGHEEFPDRVLKVRTASGKQNSQIINERWWKAHENICKSHK